jgi:hypothetical protein
MCTFCSRKTPYIVDPQQRELDAERIVFVPQELYPLFDPVASRFGPIESRRATMAAQEELHAKLIRYDIHSVRRLVVPLYRRRARDVFPVIFEVMRVEHILKWFLRELLLGIGLDLADARAILGTPQLALETGVMGANTFLVKLAIEAGADVNAPNKYGVVPLRNARRVDEELELEACAELLVQAGATV